MNFKDVKAELTAELEAKTNLNIVEEIDRKVAEYKATITESAEAEKQYAINETKRDIEAVDRLIAKEVAREEALAKEEELKALENVEPVIETVLPVVEA